MRRDLFAPLCQLQLPSHCGPCSLSASLFVLGISATQRQLAKAAGRPVSAFIHGVDEKGLRRAARAFGVKSEFVLREQQNEGHDFAVRLRRHLGLGNPAILLCRDFDHWVALIGYMTKRRRFIGVDPKDKKAIFFRWSEVRLLRNAWNRRPPGDHKEPDQYFAILLGRRDGQPAKWRVSDAWLRLCERGSVETADEMAGHLAEIAEKASPDESLIEDGPYLEEVLEEYEEEILESIGRWVRANGKFNRGDLRALYRDYETIAASSGIRVAAAADRGLLITQLTALLCGHWLGIGA